MKVFEPNQDYTGLSASVPFCNGVGETDDPRLLEWFRGRGYMVEESQEVVPEPEPVAEPEAPTEHEPVAPAEKKGKAKTEKAGE